MSLILSSAVSKFRGRKRGLIEEGSPTTGIYEDNLTTALQTLTSDANVPSYLKTIIEFLLISKDKLDGLSRENEKLYEELRLLREENTRLRSLANVTSSKCILSETSLPGSTNLQICTPSQVAYTNHSHDCYERKEMERSIVIAGIPECRSSRAVDCINFDYDCVFKLISFLDVPVRPVAVYRMGRRVGGRPRLVKVVLPTSYFRDVIIKKSHLIRNSPFRGTFIRPSLPKSERTSTVAKTVRSSRANTIPSSGPPVSHSSPVVNRHNVNASPSKSPRPALNFSDISAVSMVTDDVALINTQGNH